MLNDSSSARDGLAVWAIIREHVLDSNDVADLNLHQLLLLFNLTLLCLRRIRHKSRSASRERTCNPFVVSNNVFDHLVKYTIAQALIESKLATKHRRYSRHALTQKTHSASTKLGDIIKTAITFVNFDDDLVAIPSKCTFIVTQALAATKDWAEHVPAIFFEFPTRFRAYLKSVPQNKGWKETRARKTICGSQQASSSPTSSQQKDTSNSCGSKQGPSPQISVFNAKDPSAAAQFGCWIGKVNGRLPLCHGPKCHWQHPRTLSRSTHMDKHVEDGDITADQLRRVRYVANHSTTGSKEESWTTCFLCLYPLFQAARQQLNPYHGEPLMRGVADPLRHVQMMLSQQSTVRGLLPGTFQSARGNAGLGIDSTPGEASTPVHGPRQPQPTAQPRRTSVSAPSPLRQSYAIAASAQPSVVTNDPPARRPMPLIRHYSNHGLHASGVQASNSNPSPSNTIASSQPISEINVADASFLHNSLSQATIMESRDVISTVSARRRDSFLLPWREPNPEIGSESSQTPTQPPSLTTGTDPFTGEGTPLTTQSSRQIGPMTPQDQSLRGMQLGFPGYMSTPESTELATEIDSLAALPTSIDQTPQYQPLPQYVTMSELELSTQRAKRLRESTPPEQGQPFSSD